MLASVLHRLVSSPKGWQVCCGCGQDLIVTCRSPKRALGWRKRPVAGLASISCEVQELKGEGTEMEEEVCCGCGDHLM